VLSEHKHCNNMANNSNSKKPRSRIEESSVGKCMGTKEDESGTVQVGAAGFHHVTARSRLVCVLKFMNCFYLLLNFFSGRLKTQITDNQCIWGHDCNCMEKNQCFFSKKKCLGVLSV
jgi:hypothetical protein